MRVLVVSQYFWPENFRINDLCSEMVAKGHTVTVLTGEPNYPSGIKEPDYLRDKSEYLHYKGCKVVRVPLVARGEGKLRLVLNYVSYFTLASSIGLWRLRKEQFDVVFVCQLSPVTIALPAIIYRKIYGVPVVMWVLDLWPDSLRALGIIKSKKVLSIINKLVQFIYNRCDLILGQSKSFVSEIRNNCSDSVSVEYFPSWAEPIFSCKLSQDNGSIFEGKTFNILFAGNVGDAQDFPNVLKALKILRAKGVKVKLHIVGDGRYLESLKKIVSEQELDEYVKLWGRYPLEDMPAFYTSADALFVSLKSSPAFSMTIPGKVQSYMMAEKPILASLDGEGRDVINYSGSGFVSNPGDYEALSRNIERMVESNKEELIFMGKSGRGYAEKEFNRDILMSMLFKRIDALVSRKIGSME